MNNEKWELVSKSEDNVNAVHRMRLPDGWLVSNSSMHREIISESICYVPGNLDWRLSE